MRRPLQDELRQRVPFAGIEEEVFLNVLRTADALLQPEAALLREHDLSFAQFNVLRILRGAGRDGTSCGDIAERMVTRDPDVTRLLDRLEERGLVRRFRDARDRRVVLAAITEVGRSLIAPLDDAVPAVHRAQLRHMTRRQLATLAELLALARTPAG